VRVGGDAILAPGLLLLRPALWPADAQVTARFHLPDGVRVAAPWPRVRDGDEAFALDPRALLLEGRIAIGRFAIEVVEAHGCRFELAVLDGPRNATAEGIRRWLVTAAGALAHLYGRFPKDRALCVVRPVPARRPAMVFGQATRAGGDMLQVLLASGAPDDALPGEWIGVHEMLHLGTPWTAREESWFQEGFVTYYQEVLRARAGLLSEAEAWANLLDGFRRGAGTGTGTSLREESREMHRTHAYWRVYWAGAAIALSVDVAWRRASGGRHSLDDAMRLWWRRHGRLDRPRTGLELLAEADAALGLPVATPIARGALEASSFPDLETLLAWLGISLEGHSARLDPSAPGAATRSAIMAPRSG
jgi:hypothetical protein